jgi:hypothetical protein
VLPPARLCINLTQLALHGTIFTKNERLGSNLLLLMHLSVGNMITCVDHLARDLSALAKLSSLRLGGSNKSLLEVAGVID